LYIHKFTTANYIYANFVVCTYWKQKKKKKITDIMLWEELLITLDEDALLVDAEGACIVNNDQIRIGITKEPDVPAPAEGHL
jgi:hypothetical protein